MSNKFTQKGLLLFSLFTILVVLHSCVDPIPKEKAKELIDNYFNNNPPTFTFYIPYKDNYLWSNAESNNGDSDYIKHNDSNVYVKYYMHLMDNLKVFGAVNYHFVKEPEGCRIVTEFTDKFKSIIKQRSHLDNDGGGEHITIIAGSIEAKIKSIKADRYVNIGEASVVTISTKFLPNDIRYIFSKKTDEEDHTADVIFKQNQGVWMISSQIGNQAAY